MYKPLYQSFLTLVTVWDFPDETDWCRQKLLIVTTYQRYLNSPVPGIVSLLDNYPPCSAVSYCCKDQSQHLAESGYGSTRYPWYLSCTSVMSDNKNNNNVTCSDHIHHWSSLTHMTGSGSHTHLQSPGSE